MANVRPLRTGWTPAERPTEWTSAIVFLIAAIGAYIADRDIAALIAAGAIAVPIISTAFFSWWEARKASGVAEVQVVK